jgi:hypothetical protein
MRTTLVRRAGRPDSRTPSCGGPVQTFRNRIGPADGVLNNIRSGGALCNSVQRGRRI